MTRPSPERTSATLLGLFGCLGILLGAVNALLVQRSVVRYGNAESSSNTKKLLTGSIAYIWPGSQPSDTDALDALEVWEGLMDGPPET